MELVTVYHGTTAESAAAIVSGGFVDGTYNIVGSGAQVRPGIHHGVWVASTAKRASEHGEVVVAIDLDDSAAVDFDRSEAAFFSAVELNRRPRRILPAEVVD